jgi:hypothetical protein
MNPADTNRDLLFGLMALQNGMIDQARLAAAFRGWTRDKGRSITDQLVGRGDLDAERGSTVRSRRSV